MQSGKVLFSLNSGKLGKLPTVWRKQCFSTVGQENHFISHHHGRKTLILCSLKSIVKGISSTMLKIVTSRCQEQNADSIDQACFCRKVRGKMQVFMKNSGNICAF